MGHQCIPGTLLSAWHVVMLSEYLLNEWTGMKRDRPVCWMGRGDQFPAEKALILV